jgi:predicted transcriptional regulator
VRNGQFLGLLTLRAVQEVDREQWDFVHVADVLEQRGTSPVVSPNQSILHAWRKLADNGASRIAVVENGQLAGLLSLRDMLSYVEIRTGLGLASRESAAGPPREVDESTEQRETAPTV